MALLPILFLGGISGYAFMKARQSIKEEILQSLTTIAEQKKRQIELWLSSIHQDAILFSNHTPLSALVNRWMQDGKRDEALEKSVLARLEQIQKIRHYNAIAVFDGLGQTVLKIGEADVAEHKQLALDVIRHGETQFVDLHRNASGKIELGVLSPFINQTGKTIGALYLAVYADDYLYPLLQSWPVPHNTAETILTRRQGGEIEFISPLHLLNTPAMTKRLAMDTPALPANAGLRGFRGIYEKGLDYRGKRVLSYVTVVKGMPWVMQAKIDREEAYARIHRLGWLSGTAFGITLLGTYFIAWLVWRNRSLQNRLVMENEMRWLVALGSHEMGVWDWRLDTGRVLYSPRWKAMLGYADDEIEDNIDAWKRLIHPDDGPGVMHELEDYFLGIKHQYRADIRLLTKEGIYRWVHTCGKVTEWSPERTPLRMIGTHTDIDERKRAEIENLRLVAIIEASRDLISISDAVGSITYMNPAGRSLLGIDPCDNLKMTGIQQYYPAWAYELVLQIGLPCATRKGIWMGDTAMLTKDGREVPVSLMLIAPKKNDGSGEVDFYATIARDITERKMAEAILHEREETFRRLFQDSLDPVFLMKGLHFVECNQAALDLLRLTKDEFIGLTPGDISPEYQGDGNRSDAKATEIINLLSQGEGQRFDWHYVRRDGTDFYVEVSLTPITIGGSPFFYCGWRDITERKQITESLAEAKKAAEGANQAKSAFLANMSHEIRTPLNGILGKAQLMKMHDLDTKDKERIQSIFQAAQHLLYIVNDILDISKIEAGKFVVVTSDFSVLNKIQDVISLLTEKAEESGVTLGFVIDPSLPPALEGDATRIQQMLLNLVGNAVKFTENGSVTIKVQRVEPGEGQFLVRFEVQDTGMGISLENQTRLFNDFEQLDNQSTRRFGGTGLGLALCKRFAEQMGGSIGVISEVGVGSTFWFTIPLSKGSEAATLQDDPSSTDELARRLAQGYGNACVLLVEDNLTNKEIVVELLQVVGIAVDWAANGEQGVEMAAARNYDLILMDIQMPIMDGMEATRRIRRLPGRASVPIVALTANAFAEDVSLYLQTGMNGHISKPIIIKDLFETMLHWLGTTKCDRRREGSIALPSAANTSLSVEDLMARLAAIPGLDPQVGINSLAGKVASYARLLQKFAERQPGEMANLRQALAEDDRTTAKRIAHTLKGLAATLGATALQTNVQRLDLAFRENLGLEEISRLSDYVIADYSALAEVILARLTEA